MLFQDVIELGIELVIGFVISADRSLRDADTDI